MRAVNDAPLLQGRLLTVASGQPLLLNPLDTASDVEGDTLAVVLVDMPQHGVLSATADGRLRYVSTTGYGGLDSFSYRVNDGQADSATVTVGITVVNDGTVNDPPTARDTLAQGSEDTALRLLWSHFDVADPQNTPLSIVISALPVEGLLQKQGADSSWVAVLVGDRFTRAQVEAGALRLLPAAQASGGPGYTQDGDGNRRLHYARIGYKAFDGELASAAASLVIDIAPVADLPLLQRAGTGAVQGSEDQVLLLPALTAALADTDGSETLQLTLSGLPVGFVISDGVLLYTGNAAQPVLNLAGWNLATLQLAAPRDYKGSFQLQVQARALEAANGDSISALLVLPLEVVAVADMPALQLAPRDVAVSREVVATSWETVANTNTAASVVMASTLEGWTVTPARPGKSPGFEVYAAGDIMRNAGGNGVFVQPMAGNGTRWLRLNNGGTVAYQTLGIERDVATIAGAQYTFSFDYAGGPAFTQASGLVGVYLDGVLLGTYSNTSPVGSLNWQTVTFRFDGNGQVRRLTLALEGGNAVATSTPTIRAANIDDLRLVETLPVGAGRVYGLVDTLTSLPQVAASVTDTSGSETLRLEVLALPAGATLSDGVRSFTATASATAVDVTGWNLARLGLQAAAGWTGVLTLQVRATSTEASNGASASSTQAVVVTVLPGQAVATPPGTNPYVTLLSAGPQAAGGALATVQSDSGRAAPLLASRALGAYGEAPALPTPRKAEEEAAAEQERARRQGDAWLAALEKSAKAQWNALVAPVTAA